MSKGSKIHLAAGLALLSILALPKQGGAADGNPGKDLFDRRCSGCHALDKEKEGPRLRGVFGRASATVPDFQYFGGAQSPRSPGTLPLWING